jgi:hypothetical protein
LNLAACPIASALLSQCLLNEWIVHSRGREGRDGPHHPHHRARTAKVHKLEQVLWVGCGLFSKGQCVGSLVPSMVT